MKYFFKTNSDRIKRNTSRRDIIFMILCSGLVLVIALMMTRGNYLYGSQVDWLSQHSVLPDYFRKTFYETGNLFPDFNINLGAGQNAYNIAYYGYFSPVILISYFLPFVPMQDYIMFSSIAIVMISGLLIFYWLKMQEGLSRKEIYFGTILFVCCGPLIYHSHMQVMFINYMPFLIMSFMGIDLLYKDNNRRFLTINIALMFLTSYFFAFASMFALSIYAIYKYLDKPEFFLRRVKDYSLSCIVGIMMSCTIILPAFGAILSGRSEGAKSDHSGVLELFIPEITSKNIGYTAYCMGLPAILAIALLVFVLFEKSKAKKFLGISVLLFTVIPFLRYALNGFLYTREKALIPFVPLGVLIVVLFARNFTKNKYSIIKCAVAGAIVIAGVAFNIEYGSGTTIGYRVVIDVIFTLLFMGIDKFIIVKKHKQVIKFVYVYSALIAIAGCMIINETATLVKVEDADKYFNQNKLEVISDTLKEDVALYRFTDLCNSKYTNNHFWGQRYLSVGCYSSVSNQQYIEFCNYDLGINNPTVNDITVVPPSDVMFNTFMGTKYISSDIQVPVGYELYKRKGDYTVNKNENAYSIGFATDDYMTKSDYEKLEPEDKEMALLQSIVIEDEQVRDSYNKVDYKSKFEKVNVDTSMGMEKDEDGYYSIKTGNSHKNFVIEIPDSLDEYVYVVKCSIKGYTNKRATIRVDGIQNSLSGLESAYPNKNFDFKFVVSSNIEKRYLDVQFTKGCSFKFSELELYRIKYEDIISYRDKMTMLENVKTTHENTISGHIFVENDSLFTTTIPYDEGFTVYVDGKKIDYFKTDKAFLGFHLEKGSHKIEMVYKAPYAMEGKIIAIIGLLILIFVGSKGINLSKNKPEEKSA